MAPVIPTSYPSSFGLGTTLKVLRSHSDFPASDGWTLTLVVNGPTSKSWTAIADNDAYLVTISSADSTQFLQAGKYYWKEYVSKAGERYEVASDVFDVTPDYSGLTANGAKTENERILEAITAKIEGRITSDAESYSIAGRSISKIPMADLMKYRAIYAQKVAQERGNYKWGRVEFDFAGRG